MQLLPLASFAATAVAIAIGMSGVERVALVAGGVLPPLLSRAGHREMADADCKGGGAQQKK